MFSPRKGHFVLFLSVSLCFSLTFFGFPLFQSIYLCLSLSLSLSLSRSCPFFPSCLFFLVPGFCFFLSFRSSLFLLHEGSNIKILNCKVFLHHFFGFLSCFFIQILFSYLCFFLISSYVFVQHQCIWLKKSNLENTNFGQKGGCNKTLFFEPVSCKM